MKKLHRLERLTTLLTIADLSPRFASACVYLSAKTSRLAPPVSTLNALKIIKIVDLYGDHILALQGAKS